MSDATNTSMPSSAGPAPVRPAPSKTTSVADGAAKVFREFKWGLLTLFLLMVVVIGLVYDGGRKKKSEAPVTKAPTEQQDLVSDLGPESGLSAQPSPPGMRDEPLPPVGTAPLPSGPTPPVGNAETAPRDRTEYLTGVTNEPRNIPIAPPKATETLTVAPEKPAESMGGETIYTVLSGDTLSGIAGKHYPGKTQSGIKNILAANKTTLPDPNRLRVGMKLKIPAPVAEKTVAKAEVKVETKGAEQDVAVKQESASVGGYTVQAGDTLERIARKVLKDSSRWSEIYELNRDRMSDPSRLKVGMNLKVPGVKESASTGKANLPGKAERTEKIEKKERPSTRAEEKVTVNNAPAPASNERMIFP